MGIRTIIAVSFAFIAINAQAATNSWTSAAGNFWDIPTAWSLSHEPLITDAADFITNVNNKVVVIDDTDTADFPESLTISNLTVAGAGTTTNTLNLTNMNLGAVIPLNVLNTLTIGARGQLQIDDSMLQAGNASFATNSTLLFALGTNFTSVVVSNNLTLGGKLNVADAGGFFNTGTYTLFTYGGALVNNGLTVGATPSGTNCTIDTSTAGLVKLIVSGFAPPPSGVFQIVALTRSGNDITIKWTAASAGSNTIQATSGNANGYTNNFADISGFMIVTPGLTNTYIEFGGATNLPSRFYRVRAIQ